MDMPHVDLAGALALAQAMGAPPEVAGPLLAACADGITTGFAERRRGA